MVSKHISDKEATFSQTATRLGISNAPTEEHLENMKSTAENVFEPLREWCGHPIRINSFYRSVELNKAIGGSSSRSQHLQGKAIDIDSLGKKTNAELFYYIKDNLDFDQLIWEFGSDEEPDWIHLSYNSKDNRKQILKAYKDKNGKSAYITFI
jgi:zinc D-Ala-D-Ala carboxypeptidase